MSLYIEQSFNLALLVNKWGSNLSFRIVETGGAGGTKTISLATGKYFIRTAVPTLTPNDPDDAAVTLSIASLVAALQTAINGAPLACTYTVSFSVVTERITITAAPGGSGVTSIAIDNLSTTTQRVIGFTSNRSLFLSHVADRAPYFWIKGNAGGLSEYFWNAEAPPDTGGDLKSHGGEVYGVSQNKLPKKFDAIVPCEPLAKLWNDHVDPTAPYTWERFFEHGRGRQPILFDLQDGTVTKKFVVQMREEGMIFEPIPRQTKNYWAKADIRIQAWRRGTAP